MFTQILFTQWKWSGWAVILGTVVAFSVPIFAVQSTGFVDPGRLEIQDMLARVEGFGYLFPVVAGAAGIALALLAWASDHAGNHVYALSLPVPRWYYVLLRFGAGVLLLVPVMLAVWIGTLTATSLIDLPTGLRAYPHAIALRFAVVALTGYAFFFALAAGTIRTALIALGVAPTALLALNQVILLVGGPNLLLPALEWVVAQPGPWELAFEPWMLVNV